MQINTGKESLEFGGLIEPGDYIFEWQEGMKRGSKESVESITDERVSFLMMAKSIDVVRESDKPGDPESIGRNVNNFVLLIKKDGNKNDFGEKQLAQYITMAPKVLAKLEKKYPDDTPFSAAKFLDDVALALPGSRFGGRVRHREQMDSSGKKTGRMNAEFEKVWALSSVAGKADSKSDVKPDKEAENDGGFD